MIRTLLSHTEAVLQSIKYIVSPIEHTIVATRARTQEQINFCLDHWNNNRTLTLAVFDTHDPEQLELKDQIILSYEGARLLRDFLNRPEIACIINEENEPQEQLI